MVFILSFFYNGMDVASAAERCSLSSDTKTACDASVPVMGREMCFVAFGGNAFSGSDTSHTGSIRLTQTGRRVNPSTKTTFKLIKSGKVMDGRGSFLTGVSLFQPLPDLFSFNQQLYLMGVLRL